jgi:hypothetical protein
MNKQAYDWFNKIIPPNYIIKNPYVGSFILALFCFGFILLYQPTGSHPAQNLSFEATIAIYSLGSAISLLGIVWLLRSLNFFSSLKEWTILKEFLSILVIIAGIGISVYFLGFIIEEPADRWNFATFFNSMKGAFMFVIIPLILFTSMNFRYWFAADEVWYRSNTPEKVTSAEFPEELININSRLKNEELGFYPGELIYAESDGNYVNFYLNRNNQIKKEVIRNSINNIEEQLADFPYLVRTHRAFIVNLKKIQVKKGNTLGYRLKLTGIDQEIPVSRNNTNRFSKLFRKFS